MTLALTLPYKIQNNDGVFNIYIDNNDVLCEDVC